MIDLTIKPGTKCVIIESGWNSQDTLAEFVRNTPTGRIVLRTSSGRERTFNPDGYERGSLRGGSYSRARTRLARPEDLERFEAREIVNDFQSATRTDGQQRCELNKFSIENLRILRAALDMSRRDAKLVAESQANTTGSN